MDFSIEENIQKSREYTVSKSNQIVQKSRYNFSVAEQRIIAYICSQIKPTDPTNTSYQLEYEFDILAFANICGFENNGKLYSYARATLKSLRDKSMWITLPNGSETTVSWLAKVTISKRNGTANIEIDKDMAPYLFDLKNKFLSYGLKNILNMTSQYSIRLYELLRSYHDERIGMTDHRNLVKRDLSPQKTSHTIDLDELKKQLMVENIKSYSNFAAFRRKVLDIAKSEINILTDTDISFEPITKGKKVVKIKFSVRRKPMKARIDADRKNGLLFNAK